MIGVPLIGVVIGDAAGSVYEINAPDALDFPLFTPQSQPTDDTVLTLAVARAVIAGRDDPERTRELVRHELVEAINTWPRAGYGNKLLQWALSEQQAPYGSWANGAAMRVAPVAWIYESLEAVEQYARITAEVTHNHPEGVLGAQTVAGLIWLAKNRAGKDEMRCYAERFYDLGHEATDWNVIGKPMFAQKVLRERKTRSARYSIPRSILAFLESNSFEEAVRYAVCLGGDTDTQGAIAGAIAEAYYGGVPEELKNAALQCCSPDIRANIELYLLRD